MDACNIDEIQNLFIYYSACFSKYFPELGFYCNEREFQIHGIVRRYSDITGVSHDEVPPESWTLNYNFINSLHNELGIVPGSFHLASF